MVEAWEWF